jgi:hypothetical protein
LLSKNIAINKYRPVIFPAVSYGYETWSPILRRKQAEGVREYGAEEVIWAREGRGNRGVEKTT